MPIDERTSIHLADLFSALSDPTRLSILSALIEREMNVGEIAAAINLSKSAISHQLRGLRQLRIVRPRKEGRQVFYCIEDEHVAQIFQMGLNHIIQG